MDRLEGLLGKLEDVRDDFQRQLNAVIADPSTPAQGEDRPHLVEMLKESVGSFTFALERFKR